VVNVAVARVVVSRDTAVRGREASWDDCAQACTDVPTLGQVRQTRDSLAHAGLVL